MSKSRSRQTLNYGKSHCQVDASDLLAARELGILREDVNIDCSDSSNPSYGVAYALRENIASSEFSPQNAIHSKRKDFAIKCGFQIFVKQTSVKDNNSGNSKFACKNLNGMQFFDHESAPEQLSCPFFINVHGKLGKWKITQANFAHNHLKFIGTSTAPCVEGSIPLPAKAKRNTTQTTSKLTAMIEGEILPVHNGSTTTMTGTAIKKFLKTKGADVSASVVSRLKQAIDEKLHGDLAESYQKLEAYFTLMGGKNPGSVWVFEKSPNGNVFGRACFLPNVGIHMARFCKPLIGFDGVHLKQEMNKQGVYLVATVKDYNNHIVPFGLEY